MGQSIMDETFEVDLAPDAAAQFLRDPHSWERLIPGVMNDPAGKLLDVGNDSWTLSGSGLRYSFTDAVLTVSSTPATLVYNVRVRGKTAGCVPLDFSIHVEYDFSGAADQSTRVRRRVDLVKIHRLAVLGPLIKSSTHSACLKENAKMVMNMKKGSKQPE